MAILEKDVPLIESVEDLASLATEEVAGLYEVDSCGETERNSDSHDHLSSDEADLDEEFENLAPEEEISSLMR